MADPQRNRDLGTKHQFHGLQPELPVAGALATVNYYRDVLGFEVDFIDRRPPMHARVKKGDRTYGDPVFIHFGETGGTSVKGFGGQFRIHVGHDVDGLFATYQKLGVDILAQPITQPWGLREFSIRDCNGYTLCFCGYVADESPRIGSDHTCAEG